MIMIYFAISNNWVGIIMSVHFSTVVEIVVLIIPHRTRQSFKSSRIVFQVMVAVEEDVFVVAKIIKAMGTMNRSRLECQILPTSPTMEFTVLMGYGLLIVANVIMEWRSQCSQHWYLLCCPFDWCQLSSPSNYPLHHHCSSKNIGNEPSAPVVNTASTVPWGRGISQGQRQRLLKSFILLDCHSWCI